MDTSQDKANRRIQKTLDHIGRVRTLSPAPTLSLFDTVRETERTGGDLVADVLKAHGVPFVFTLVGGHISPILVAAKQRGIRVIDVRHEVTTVFAADAVARLTGVPGVAAVTAGPGVTNTVTAVKNAQMAQSPVVLIGGAAASLLRGRGSLQDIDQMAVLKPIVKFTGSVTRVKDIVPTLRKAFQEAMSGVPGPVYVEFPLDILYPVGEVRSSMGLSVRQRCKDINTPELIKRVIVPEEFAGKTKEQFLESKLPDQPVFLESKERTMPWIIEKYMQYKLHTIFAGGFEQTDLSPLPVECPLASADQIQSAVKLLLGAKKPVLLVGSQATLNANRINDLQQAVAVIGAPSFLGGMARGLMGRNHQLHIRQGRGKALKQADVVIMAGAVADFRLDYGRALSSKSKIIAVNRSSDDLKLNTDAFWKPTIAICGDPGDFLLKLSQALTAKRRGPPATWETFRAELKRNEETVESTNSAKAAAPARGHSTVSGDKTQESLVNPLAACFAVDGALHDQSILVADGGDFVATAAYTVRPRKPLGWLDPGAFGTLGVGGGFALGAKLCRPDNDVWLIWGDGSSGYSVAEFDTFKRHGLGVIAVVGNDACWTQIEREQIPMFQDNVACPLEYTPYNTVAEGYGGHGIEVKTGDTQKVAEALKEAQSIAAQGVPVLVNVHIGGTDFREGSLSV